MQQSLFSFTFFCKRRDARFKPEMFLSLLFTITLGTTSNVDVKIIYLPAAKAINKWRFVTKL